MIRLIVILVVLFQFAVAADSWSIKFFGLSIHPHGSENSRLMPRNPDGEGKFVLNVGAVYSYDYFLWEDIFALKFAIAAYSDCAAQQGGFFHVGFRGKIFGNEQHSLYGGIGPTLLYRKDWARLPGYVNSGYFEKSDDGEWEYRFLWYGGDFEYNYLINEDTSLSVSFVPGYPDLMSLSVGVRFWTR